jgi:hypothetical protein
METNKYEAKAASADETTNSTYESTRSDEKAHYAADDDINWDTWWGEYIDGE